jgi:tRNA(Ile)-lysidine synthase
MKQLDRSDYTLIRRFIDAFPESLTGAPVLVAVSGGSDSIALLELLQQARSSKGVEAETTALYIDHGQRPETPEEAAFVKDAANRSGAKFERATIDDPSHTSEAELREARYTAIEEVADRIGARFIATGHTRDDQIETFLLRLFRGAGRHGLTGIPGRRGNIVRPLLGMTRDELRSYLQRRAITWRDDPSNATDVYTRNRLRNDLIPAIHAALGGQALEHLPEMSRRLAAEEAFLEGEAARYRDLVLVNRGSVLDLTALKAVPAALRPRLLRAWLAGRLASDRTHENAGKSAMISMNQLSELERLIESSEGSAGIDLAGLRIERAYDRLSACAAREGECLPQSFLYKVKTEKRSRFVGPQGDWEIRVDPAPSGPLRRAKGPERECIEVSSETLRNSAVLRPTAPGDRIDLAGHGLRKVRDIMTDRRLPQRLRSAWPVLATSEQVSRVLWVPGLAIARDLVVSENEQSRVRLDWIGSHIGASRELP